MQKESLQKKNRNCKSIYLLTCFMLGNDKNFCITFGLMHMRFNQDTPNPNVVDQTVSRMNGEGLKLTKTILQTRNSLTLILA